MYKILRLTDVKENTGLAKSTIYKMISKELFPKPIHISTKAVGWLESDIQKWIEKRISYSSNKRDVRTNNSISMN